MGQCAREHVSINKFKWDLNQSWNLLYVTPHDPDSWHHLIDRIGAKIAAAVRSKHDDFCDDFNGVLTAVFFRV